MSKSPTKPSFARPAGGWAALKSSAEHLISAGNPLTGVKSLLNVNQPEGFDCPGCAWGDPKHTSSFEFCESGVKAVSWEATSKRCTPEVMDAHTVTWLAEQDDCTLESLGRLTHPMIYDAPSDTYKAIDWDEAFAVVGRELRALDHPDQALFYTSGRTSNEAAFLWQLFVREFGTNNLPDCSNMCHEASGVALGESIGIGKGTILLEDMKRADAIFIFGQNPGTNHPRMLGDLKKAARRGAKIVTVNPLRERGLERFACHQPQYSLVVRDIEEEIVPACDLKGLGIVCWSPLAGGYLGGKYKPGDAKVAGTRSAEGWAYPSKYFCPQADAVLAALLDAAKEIGRSPAEVALRWVLDRPFMTSAIVGARTAAQAAESMKAGGWRLPEAIYRKLEEVSALPPRYPRSMETGMDQRRAAAVKMPGMKTS